MAHQLLPNVVEAVVAMASLRILHLPRSEIVLAVQHPAQLVHTMQRVVDIEAHEVADVGMVMHLMRRSEGGYGLFVGDGEVATLEQRFPRLIYVVIGRSDVLGLGWVVQLVAGAVVVPARSAPEHDGLFFDQRLHGAELSGEAGRE